MDAITAAVHELAALSVRVLSPADPRIVAQQGEFLFVASDPTRSVRLVQDRHLESIRAANFVWLICPDGYVGQSASMEIGFAAAAGVPIFAAHQPADLTLRQYVHIVADLKTAVSKNCVHAYCRRAEGILVDPHASVEKAHYVLDRIGTALIWPSNSGTSVRRIYHDVAELQKTLALPAYVQ